MNDTELRLACVSVQGKGYTRRMQIVAMLKERGRATSSELASAFNVVPRTIFRDMQLLQDHGLPIKGKRGDAYHWTGNVEEAA